MAKQILLVSFQSRGLNPTEAELERIRASRDGEEIDRWLARVGSAPSVSAVLDGAN
jgi:hypothetical protein